MPRYKSLGATPLARRMEANRIDAERYREMTLGRARSGGSYNPRRGTTRLGYSSVARSRGAAVTGEMKYFDCTLSDADVPSVTTTWVANTMRDPATTVDIGDPAVATPLCLIAPKVSAALNGRIGRGIHVHAIKVRGQIHNHADATESTGVDGNVIRLMLVQDMQTNASQMTGAQLMNDAADADATIFSYQNPNSFGRFKVLKEKTIVIQDPNTANDTGATGGLVRMGLNRPFKLNYKFKVPVKVQFNATNGGTVADIVDNSFHILAAADNNTQGPKISYYSRVSYKE